MKKEDTTVSIEGNHIVIRGDRENVMPEKTSAWFLREIEYGMFERSLPIPMDAGSFSAKMKDG
jgi:HSP20 family molecular chaperone IbpA